MQKLREFYRNICWSAKRQRGDGGGGGWVSAIDLQSPSSAIDFHLSRMCVILRPPPFNNPSCPVHRLKLYIISQGHLNDPLSWHHPPTHKHSAVHPLIVITLLLYIYTRACDSKATTTTTDKKTTIILWGLFKNSNCTHTFHVVGWESNYISIIIIHKNITNCFWLALRGSTK